MAAPLALIPWPCQLERRPGTFVFDGQTAIQVDPTWEAPGAYLADQLVPLLGRQLPVGVNAGNIVLAQAADDNGIGEEGYRLRVASQGVRIEAAGPAGAFYGLQTLLQLIEGGGVPAVEIVDRPRYAWRGMMLDVARHFFPVPVIKQLIDWLAAYKFNRLHLHLSDDQGWRIEIKSWPRLAEWGGSTAVDGDPGGYYSQADYAAIVEYAASRNIEVVPEIDMPGHSNAGLAAYPELNCDDQAPELYTGIEVGFSSLCIGKEITYQFVADVLGELAALTPGRYLHIGGDEAHSTEADAYRRFMARVQPIVAATGKQVVGWQEMARSKLPTGALLQYWDERLEFKPPAGVGVILSPASRAYLDMKYTADSPLGLEWAGAVGLRQAYDWDPGALLPSQQIAGIEAPLWTETLRSQADLEYMLFPRLPGLAEVGWSPQKERNWDGYRPRLAAHAARWQRDGINYYHFPELK